MAKNLKEAIEKNRVAAQDLDRALRDCLEAIRERSETVVEGRFLVVEGGRRQTREDVTIGAGQMTHWVL